jgi:cell division protein FtsN
MLFGLTLGLAAAVLIYLTGALPRPTAPRSAPAEARTPTPASSRDNANAGGRSAAAANDSARRSGAGDRGGERASDETQFDFYEILPRYEVVVPEVEAVTKSAPAGPATPVETPGKYVLQAGSFRSHEEADRMQASLALLGIESRIQKVTIDADEFHRVRIGPISNLETLNRVRGQLRGAGINPLVMRVND